MPPRNLAPEVVQVVLGKPPFEESPGIDARRRVRLEIDEIAGMRLGRRPEEVIETNLEQIGDRSIGSDVAAEFGMRLISPLHHHQRIPAVDRGEAHFQIEVAWIRRLRLDRNGVAIGRRMARVEPPTRGAPRLDQAVDEKLGTPQAVALDHIGQAGDPVLRFFGVEVRRIDHRPDEMRCISNIHGHAPLIRHIATR